MSALLQFPGFPPAAAARMASKLLNRHSPHEIAEAIEVLMDVLDLLGGEPDDEDNDPSEADGDERDISWPNRIAQRACMGGNMGTEDDEEDDPDTGVEDGRFDPEEDRCDAGDDE